MNDRTAAARAADTEDTTGADDTAIEERARRIGWVPKDEFRGDPDKWSPAADFLERGERTLPILLERNRKIDDKLGRVETENKALKKQLDEMNGTLKEARDTFVEFRQSTANVERRAHERAREELREEMKTAVKSADLAAYDLAEAKLTELDKTAPKVIEPAQRREPEKREPEKREPEKTEQPGTAEPSEAVKRWADANPWFKNGDENDPEAAEDAISLFATNMRKGMAEEDNLAAVRKKIEVLHPHLFENTRRSAPAPVIPPSGGGGRRQRGNSRTFEDLPQDAKDAYTRFHKQDPKFTKDDYLRDYMWDAQ